MEDFLKQGWLEADKLAIGIAVVLMIFATTLYFVRRLRK